MKPALYIALLVTGGSSARLGGLGLFFQPPSRSQRAACGMNCGSVPELASICAPAMRAVIDGRSCRLCLTFLKTLMAASS